MSSPLSSQSRENKGVSLRPTRAYICQVRPSTNSPAQGSEIALAPSPQHWTGKLPFLQLKPLQGRVTDPSAVLPPAGCTIRQSSRCPPGAGRTSGTRHRHVPHLLDRCLPGARAETPSGSLPACAAGDIAQSGRNPSPPPARAAFAFSHPSPRTAVGCPDGCPTLQAGTIRADHVPQGGHGWVRCSLSAGSVACP